MPNTAPAKIDGPKADDEGIQFSLDHWQRSYIGMSCFVLRDRIREYDGVFGRGFFGPRYYSKVLPIIQSSGTGKSRLADEYGRTCPMMTYVLRERNADGFSPSDREVYQFMLSYPKMVLENYLESPESCTIQERMLDCIWCHAVAIGILQATFERCKSPPNNYEEMPSGTWSVYSGELIRYIGNQTITEWRDDYTGESFPELTCGNNVERTVRQRTESRVAKE